MFKKTFLFSAVTVLVAAMSVATASALLDVWNRPNPLMDYVPQEMGIYDTRYDRLTESDCRDCHGDSLAARHHYAPLGSARQCDACHDLISDSPGVLVIVDCMTGGCHSWEDVYSNGWHHDTDLSGSENCVICHDRNVVAELTPFASFANYPPSVVTPTPFSCENCHWGQAVVDQEDRDPPGNYFPPADPEPEDAGHPSTYDHVNESGQFTGYYEYNKEIMGNEVTHHMGEKGSVATQCWKCHANDPNDPSYDPDDPELIRYCEICHDISTLHTIFAHVGPPGSAGGPAVEAWEAAGFHVAGSTSDIPTVYRGNGLIGYGASPSEYFEANEQCFGCHGDNVPGCCFGSLLVPVLRGVSPNAACPTGLIEISGSNFGGIRTDGEDEVQLRLNAAGQPWTTLDSPDAYYSWSNDLIIIEIPAWDFAPGNYNVKVVTERGTSAKKTFTIYDCISPQEIKVNNSLHSGGDPFFNAGVCTNTISLENGTGGGMFGIKDQVAKGIYGVVQFSASQGDYIVLNELAWNNSQIKFKFKTFFEDLNGNFVQDGNEPSIINCSDLALGTYSVYIKYIFYIDSGPAGYDAGDTMTQVETSNPVTFGLENTPYINRLNPKQVSKLRRLRVIGQNFGPQQTTGNVYVGTGSHYNLMVATPTVDKGKIQDKVKLWSNTKVMVNFRVRNTWKGTNKWVWVVKDGMVSNKRRVEILP
jgi:hypothetical protein